MKHLNATQPQNIFTAPGTQPKGRAPGTAPPSCDVVVWVLCYNCLSRATGSMARLTISAQHGSSSYDINFAFQYLPLQKEKYLNF
jgi:hypothetical protein